MHCTVGCHACPRADNMWIVKLGRILDEFVKKNNAKTQLMKPSIEEQNNFLVVYKYYFLLWKYLLSGSSGLSIVKLCWNLREVHSGHLRKLMWSLNRGNWQLTLPRWTLQCRHFVQILSKLKLCYMAFTVQWPACGSQPHALCTFSHKKEQNMSRKCSFPASQKRLGIWVLSSSDKFRELC